MLRLKGLNAFFKTWLYQNLKPKIKEWKYNLAKISNVEAIGF